MVAQNVAYQKGRNHLFQIFRTIFCMSYQKLYLYIYIRLEKKFLLFLIIKFKYTYQFKQNFIN